MTPEAFIKQQADAGYRIHEHGGVAWQMHRPFFYKPANPMQVLRPVADCPAPWRALVGYAHLVSLPTEGNKVRSVMVREWPGNLPFSMEHIPSKKRNQVRKGLKLNEVRRIEDLEAVLSDLKAINIETRIRIGVGLPAHYYDEQYQKWRRDMLRLFRLDDRDWWGAFYDGKLVAYYYCYAIRETLIIDTAKSHTAYMGNNPIDALLFTIMEDAFNRQTCRRMIYGDWTPDDENLTRFKQKYGFERQNYPEFQRLWRPVRAAFVLRNAVSRWRARPR